MSLAAAGGVGGGEIVVPCIKLFFGFSGYDAVPLAQTCICISACSRFCLNFFQRHPKKDAVVIDYTMAAVLLPMIVFGSTIGVILNVWLPEIVETIMLVVLLLFTGTKCLFKGVKTWKEET